MEEMIVGLMRSLLRRCKMAVLVLCITQPMRLRLQTDTLDRDMN